MDKFKVFDKVKRIGNFGALFDRETVYTVESVGINTLALEGIKGYWHDIYFELANEWTIYNNDKPLSELSDEQVGAIVRYGIEKGPLEVADDNGQWYGAKCFDWHTALAYRAKQKSERELFIEAADYFIDCGDEPVVMAGKMFDAGFKAPKGGE